MKKIVLNKSIYCLIITFSFCMLNFTVTTAQVIKKEYRVQGKTIVEKKYMNNAGDCFYSYAVEEFLDSINTIMKTRKSVFTKDHHIAWRDLSIKEQELPRLGNLFYDYADSLFSLGDSHGYLDNLNFFIYDTGGIIVQRFFSDKDLIGEYGYGSKIIELMEKLHTFRFSTPVLAHFDKDYFVDNVCWSDRKTRE